MKKNHMCCYGLFFLLFLFLLLCVLLFSKQCFCLSVTCPANVIVNTDSNVCTTAKANFALGCVAGVVKLSYRIRI